MEISSVSNASFSRSVTPSKSSSDRQSNTHDESQAKIAENKAQERTQQQRATQQKLQQNKEESQRRLDGRLISFGHEPDPQKQASMNRSRVDEAYNPPKNDLTNSHKQHSDEREAEAIDIVI